MEQWTVLGVQLRNVTYNSRTLKRLAFKQFAVWGWNTLLLNSEISLSINTREYLPWTFVYFTVTCWADKVMVGHGSTLNMHWPKLDPLSALRAILPMTLCRMCWSWTFLHCILFVKIVQKHYCLCCNVWMSVDRCMFEMFQDEINARRVMSVWCSEQSVCSVQLRSLFHAVIYRVAPKSKLSYFVHIFAKYWPIFTIFSPVDSVRNLLLIGMHTTPTLPGKT